VSGNVICELHYSNKPSFRLFFSLEQRKLPRRNYKNPQTDSGDEQIVLLPARPAEKVTNPLVAEGNYKR